MTPGHAKRLGALFLEGERFAPHDLFHYEDILRNFCKTYPVAINLHDAVYIPAEETELIQVLTDQLDSHGYLYQVTQH